MLKQTNRSFVLPESELVEEIQVDFIFTHPIYLPLPLYLHPVKAGFPSPADDYVDRTLDLNEYLVKHLAATFFLRVSGDSMLGAGIHPGDILIVDRALRPQPGQIVIAVIDSEFTVKRLCRSKSGKLYLSAENPAYPTIELRPDQELEFRGVVTCVLHQV